jgi:undecaprenyl-diphosphatase
MEISDSIILGVLQGISEFLPISSSGHLVLGEHYLGLNVDVLKSFDVIVHLGTLLAILIYFRSDIFKIITSLLGFLNKRNKSDDPYVKLCGYILIGTIPAAFVGLLFEDYIDSMFRNFTSVGMFMLIVGIVYIFGEYSHKRIGNRKMTWHKALIIGLFQAVALIPGISRSGSTIVAGLFQGINRSEAARFSFLLGIPAIGGAGVLTSINILKTGEIGASLLPLIIGFFVSFLFGLISITFLMRFLKTNTLIVFSIYLIALGLSTFIL